LGKSAEVFQIEVPLSVLKMKFSDRTSASRITPFSGKGKKGFGMKKREEMAA